jgi:hypothetical protein
MPQIWLGSRWPLLSGRLHSPVLLTRHPGILDWLANLTMIPFNLLMYIWLSGFMLISPHDRLPLNRSST